MLREVIEKPLLEAKINARTNTELYEE